jgi:hypothetical protein
MRLIPSEAAQRRQITVEQAEADYFEEAKPYITREIDPLRRRRLEMPFGFNNEEWHEMKSMMQPGDQLWESCSSRKTWDQLMGVHEIELIRNGESIAAMILSLS